MKKILVLAIILRFLLMPFFFHPDIKTYNFQSSFLKHGVINIYPYLLENREKLPLKEEFVYFPLAYFSVGAYQIVASPFLGDEFAGWLADASGGAIENINLFRYLFILKLPYLFFDILIAFTLMQFFKNIRDKKKVFALWLLNPFTPVLIYVFSNIDVIPAALVLLGLAAMRKKKVIGASLLLAVASGFKAYPILFFPFLFVKAENIKAKLLALAAFVGSLGLIVFPFWSKAFAASSFASGLTTRILEAAIAISGGEKILIIPLALIVLFLFSFYAKKKIGLWRYCLAAVLIVVPLIHFHIQWLLWAAPFLAIVRVKKNKLSWLLLTMAVSAFAIPFLYNDKFMSVSLLSPINTWFALIPTPFAIVQRFADPYLVQSLIHSLLVGSSLALIWQILERPSNEQF